MKKILIYERGTVVPAEKLAAANVVIEKFSTDGFFVIHKAGVYVRCFSKPLPLTGLCECLLDYIRGEPSYEIETLARDANGNAHCVLCETKHEEKNHSTPTRLTSPRVQLENFIYDPSVVWYGPHACPTCGVEIVKSSRESGAIALDAPHNHHYPNHHWVEHECR